MLHASELPGIMAWGAMMPAGSPVGEHCAQCWAIISAVEDAHRNEDGDWEHDKCPED